MIHRPPAMPEPVPNRLQRPEVADLVLSWIREIVEVEDVTLDDDLLAIGADSLSIAILIDRVEQELGVVIDPTRYLSESTIEGIVEAIRALPMPGDRR